MSATLVGNNNNNNNANNNNENDKDKASDPSSNQPKEPTSSVVDPSAITTDAAPSSSASASSSSTSTTTSASTSSSASPAKTASTTPSDPMLTDDSAAHHSQQQQSNNGPAAATTPIASIAPSSSVAEAVDSAGDVVMKPATPRVESVKFSVKFGKENIDLELPINTTVLTLKETLAKRTSVQPSMQKLMFKGQLKDDLKTLDEVGIKAGAKLMLIGSTVEQVITVNLTPASKPEESTATQAEAAVAESEKKQHDKVLKLGPPPDAVPGQLGKQVPLTPNVPMSNMYNGRGEKIRVTVKSSSDELWIASNTTTQKLPFNQIQDVTFTDIPEHPGYSVVCLKFFGNHKVFLYFMPTQFTKNFKNYILGWDL